jgi:hypothetical protein
MVGLPGQDCGSAIELFCQHDPDQPVRPGLNAQSHCFMCSRSGGLAMPRSAADQETHCVAAIVTQSAYLMRELLRSIRLAALVEDHDMRARPAFADEPTGFAITPSAGCTFDFVCMSQAELWSQPLQPRHVIVEQFTFRSGPE